MSENALVPYIPPTPETREESLSRQFYDWEHRGRGWQVYDFPVELEPPFRPFYFFEPEGGPVADDGRVQTFFSRLFDGGSSSSNSGTALVQKEAEIRKYQEFLSAADEPEFCVYCQKEFEEVRIILPNDLKVSKSASEQLILSLAYASHPIGFEVIGDEEKIIVQFAATGNDVAQLRQQLEAHLPGCRFSAGAEESGDYLSENWLNRGDCSVIADFGLSEEFMLPLNTIQNIETDPLIAVVGAMSNLRRNETGIIQVLFQKARSDWPKEVMDIISCFEGTGFFDYLPDIKYAARQKFGSPLFAVLIRAAAKSSYNGRSMEIVRNIAGGLAQLARPSGNELIPLSNDGYDFEYHEQALLNRQSFRCGMLLNLKELVSLVHPPSQSVRSSKLVRDDRKTKAAPNIALGHSLGLGANHHQDEVNEVTLSNEQRTRHIHVVGSSGSGKSTLLLHLIKQDMANGEGLCVIDPHGDLIDEVIANVPGSRTGDVIFFDPSDAEFPIGFNILQARTELEKTILSSDLVATFRRMSTSWGDVMDSVLANAILAIIESSGGGTLFDLKRFLVEKGFRDEFLKTVGDESIRYFWTHEFPLIASKPQASILIRLDTFLRQKLVRNIVCQKETKLNFREILDDKKILLIKLSHGLIGEENSYLLGTLLVSKIYQTALSRQETQKRPYFWLYLDEFQNFITPSMESILSGSRKYHLGLTLSHQEFRQLQSRSQDVSSSVLSNSYTRICFRLGDADAEKFAAGFSSFDAKALQDLGIGEAIARIERSEYDFNLRAALAPNVERELAGKRKADIVRSTRERYSAARQRIEADLFTERAGHSDNSDKAAPHQKDTDSDRMPKSKDRREVSTTNGNEQHRYLQSIVKRIGEGKGFVATLEKEVFGGIGKVDVALENDNYKIACEIAVTNTTEYELNNIHKCLNSGFDKILVLSSDNRHLLKIKKIAEAGLTQEQMSRIHFLELESVHLFLDSLKDKDVEQQKVKGYKVTTTFKQSSESDARTRRRIILDVINNSIRRRGKSGE